MERRIRESKRKCMGLKTGVDKANTPDGKAHAEAAYRKQAALLQKRTEAYNTFCEENNLKKLSERVQVAQFDRKQAAQARAAAKRAEKSVAISGSSDTIKEKILLRDDMYPQYWTPSIGGIFMKYSYEFKLMCVDMYRQGKWPDTPKSGFLLILVDTGTDFFIRLSPADQFFQFLHNECQFRTCREGVDHKNTSAGMLRFVHALCYAGSTIHQTYIAMGTMFRSAVMNDMLRKHPMDGVRYTKPVRAVDDIKFLTVDEQKTFLEAAKRSHNYRQYALLLETGLRTGELIGLTWDAIDWKKADVHCQQNP